jgi:hypothetical protein
MKKKLTPAKMPLPGFRSDKETTSYFQTHSVADVWSQLPEEDPAKVSKALEKSIRQRHAAAKSDLNSIGSRTDRRRQEDRCRQISRLPDPVANVDSRGD